MTLEALGGTEVQELDYTAGETWTEVALRFEEWNGSTATCRFHFYASTDASVETLYISGPFIVCQTPYEPMGYPTDPAHEVSATILGLDASDMVEQYLAEGEVEIEGTCDEVTPVGGVVLRTDYGTTGQDRRILRTALNGRPTFDHYDASAAGVSSTGPVVDWTTAWHLRLRWCRAELFDRSSCFAGIVSSAAGWASYGRMSTWSQDFDVHDVVALGKDSGAPADEWQGMIRRVTLRARESKLATPPSPVSPFQFVATERAWSRPYPSVAGVQAWLGLSTVVPESLYLLQDTSTTCRDELTATHLTHNAAVLLQRQLVGLTDDGSHLDRVRGVEYVNEQRYTSAPNNTKHQYASADFGGLVVFKTTTAHGQQAGLLGHATGAATPIGWRLELGSTGIPQITLHDGTQGTTFALSSNHADGAWHYLAWWVDRTAKTIRMFSDLDKPASAALHASLGSIAGATPFKIGLSHTFQFSVPAQYAVVTLFSAKTGLDNPTGFDAWWARVTTRSLPGITHSRASTLGTVVGNDTRGDMIHVWASGEVAYAHRSGFSHASKLGAQLTPAVTNMLAQADLCRTTWAVNGTATKTSPFNTYQSSADYDDPRRMRWACKIAKTAAQGCVQQAVTLVSGTAYNFSVWVKVTTADVPVLRIRDAGDTTTKATATCTGVDGTWQRFNLTWTADASASFLFQIHPDTEANAVGECFAQYAQVTASSGPLPFAFSQGTAKTTSDVSLVTTQPVIRNDEGRLSFAFVQDYSDASASRYWLTSAVTGNNGRYAADPNDQTLSMHVNNASATSILADSDNDVALGSEHVAAFQWIAAGTGGLDAQGEFDGDVDTDAGTFTSDGLRQVLYIGKGASVASVYGVLAYVDVGEQWIASS